MSDVRQIAAVPMAELLARAGFRPRSTIRADCARCIGRSRGTVSYTEEVAFCHRCGWKGNIVTLARELGLLSSDPATRARLRIEARRRARLEAPLRAFESWRDVRTRLISDSYFALSRKAVLAHRVLLRFPDSEPAWDALSCFYHVKARLSAAFDFLMFARASEWLETDPTPAGVFRLWRERAA